MANPVEINIQVNNLPTPTTTVEKPVTKKAAKQNDLLGIALPSARFRKLLDNNGLNSDIQGKIEAVKKEILKYKKGTMDPKSTEYKTYNTPEYLQSNAKFTAYKELSKQKSKLSDKNSADFKAKSEEERNKIIFDLDLKMSELKKDYLVGLKLQILEFSKGRYRFNDNICILLGIVSHMLVSKILTHAIKLAESQKKKTVSIGHCEGINVLDIYPFIHSLPAYHNMLHNLEVVKTVQSKIAKVNETKTKNMDEAAKSNLKLQIELIKKTHETHYVPKNPSGDKFFYYIKKLKKALNDDAVDKKIKLSKDLSKFLSELVVDFVQRLCPFFTTFLHCTHTKTINKDILYSILELITIDCGSKYFPTFKLDLDLKLEKHKHFLEVNKATKKEDGKSAESKPMNGDHKTN